MSSPPSQSDRPESNHPDPPSTDAYRDVRKGADADPLDTPAVPPEWAIDGGLPGPLRDETLRAYGARLGLTGAEVDDLFVELKAGIADMANMRLEEYLRRTMPSAWAAYYDRRVTSQLDDGERRRITKIRWRLGL